MFSRSVPLIGESGIAKLKDSHVCVFGVGGVGGFVVESLARAGVGQLTIVDFDTVNESNINRQIIALHSTIGMKKIDVLESRIKDINPDCKINKVDLFINNDNINEFDFNNYSYVVDCVDNVTAKLAIITKAKENDIHVISSMGTGNKIDPKKFQITDISKTSVCPLAKVIRLELRKREIKGVKVLFSTEEPIKSPDFISSISFVPSSAGLLIAREVILDLLNMNNK